MFDVSHHKAMDVANNTYYHNGAGKEKQHEQRNITSLMQKLHTRIVKEASNMHLLIVRRKSINTGPYSTSPFRSL